MTVRIRVTAVAGIVVAVVLIAAAFLLVTLQRRGLTDQLDDTLAAEADRVADALEADGALPTNINDDWVVVAFDAAGAVLDRAGDEDEIASFAREVAPWRVRDESNVRFDGDPYRVVAESFNGPGGEGRVVVAGSREDIVETVADLRTSLLWVVPLAVLVLIGVVWWLVGRTLRPVERIRTEVASIGVGELARRVPVPPGGDEIARLAATMNDMLARLETSVRRQQQFVADASHELRTPLTRMRTELEVDARDPVSADPDATRRSQLEEIDELQKMIEDLLVLARGDAGAAPADAVLVDLDDIVLDEIDAAGAGDGPGGVRIDAGKVSAAQVTGAPAELRRIVRNVLDNARRHARSQIVVELAEQDGRARLLIADDGPGIPPEHRRRVFERFTRLDESRTGGGHAGLGLAIVDDLVRRHHGTVEIDDSPWSGAQVTITLPTAAATRPAPPKAPAPPQRSQAWPPPSLPQH